MHQSPFINRPQVQLLVKGDYHDSLRVRGPREIDYIVLFVCFNKREEVRLEKQLGFDVLVKADCKNVYIAGGRC